MSFDYFTNEDVLKFMPLAARNSNQIDTEIDTWRPVAQALIVICFQINILYLLRVRLLH